MIRIFLATFLLLGSFFIFSTQIEAAGSAPTAQPLSPVNINAHSPALTVTASGVIHVVWEQDGGLWHSYFQGSKWSVPKQVVSQGESPVLASAPSGDTVYLAWSQNFNSNFEIFTSRWQSNLWSLPQNVSSNTGGSITPELVVASDGLIHLFWSDTSSGGSAIYHATSVDGLVWPTAMAIPQALGGSPTARFGSDGRLYLAWQYRPNFTVPLSIWFSVYDGSWQTPIALTSGGLQALAPKMAQGSQRLALTWQEGTKVRLAYWQNDGWKPVASKAGQQPALAVTAQDQVQWGWKEGSHLIGQFGATNWSLPQTWAEGSVDSTDLAFFARENTIHTVWAAHDAQSWRIYYDSWPLVTLFLPQIESAN